MKIDRDAQAQAVLAALRKIAAGGAGEATHWQVGFHAGVSKNIVGGLMTDLIAAGMLRITVRSDRTRIYADPTGAWRCVYEAGKAQWGGSVANSVQAAEGRPQDKMANAMRHAYRMRASAALTPEQEAAAIAKFLATRAVTTLPTRCAGPINGGFGL